MVRMNFLSPTKRKQCLILPKNNFTFFRAGKILPYIIRKAFSAKSHEGYTEQIKSLITSYGAEKLSAIKEADYPSLMKDLEAIK